MCGFVVRRGGVLTVGSLFSGIGGLDLGLERAGMRVLWQCESDPYCRAVLRKHWPAIPCYEDVKRLLADTNSGNGSAKHGIQQGRGAALADPGGERSVALPDVLCGGFPCQPVSFAGRRRGTADERWLWPEFARIIRLLRPRYALMENVPGLLVGGGMAEVLGDLATCGYDAEWDCIPAAAVGAPHLRYRVFIVAVANSGAIRNDVQRLPGQRASGGEGRVVGHNGKERQLGAMADAHSSRRFEQQRPESILTKYSAAQRSGWWRTEPDVGRVAYGVPSRVDRLRALGNAVVPQVAEYVGRQIVTAHNRGAA